MHPIHFLIGALAFVIFLLLFGFIALIWALRQLVIIGDQNDAIISFLQQRTVNNWPQPHIGDGRQEDLEDAVPTRARKTEMHRQSEVYHPTEPLFAKYR